MCWKEHTDTRHHKVNLHVQMHVPRRTQASAWLRVLKQNHYDKEKLVTSKQNRMIVYMAWEHLFDIRKSDPTLNVYLLMLNVRLLMLNVHLLESLFLSQMEKSVSKVGQAVLLRLRPGNVCVCVCVCIYVCVLLYVYEYVYACVCIFIARIHVDTVAFCF